MKPGYLPVPSWSLDDIVDGGERVTHLCPNDVYWAHLSIYRFALPYALDRVVLDAGCGAGYGAAYLGERGAREVWGIDISARAIAFSRHYFQQPNLKFQIMDLERIEGFSDRCFDLIFSSNTLEHIPKVTAFLRTAGRLLKPDGTLIAAVPPITNEKLRAANEANPYHVNIWSPRQWHHVLGLFFAEVDCFRHNFKEPDRILDFVPGSERLDVQEHDFIFEAASLEQLCGRPTLTAIFVARRSRPERELPAAQAVLRYVDDSYVRPPVRWPGEDEPPPVSWWKLPQRAWEVARQKGFRAMLQRAGRVLRGRVTEFLRSGDR
jgi:SAM-dependent methyltransferase